MLDNKCKHEWYWNWTISKENVYKETAYKTWAISSIYCRKCWEIKFNSFTK